MSQAPASVPFAARLLFMLLAVASGLTGCGKSDQGPLTAQSSRYEVDDDGRPAAAQRDPAADSSLPGSPAPLNLDPRPPAGQNAQADFDPAHLDANNLPDDEAQLLSMLELLQMRQPRGRTEQEQYDDFLRLQHTRVKAAEKLLEVAGSPQARQNAVQTKLDAMRALTLARVPNMDKQLTAYCQSLQQGQDPENAFLGRLMLFGLAVDNFAEGEATDVEKLLEELKRLAADARQNPGAFMVISQAAEVLQRSGEREAAIEAYRAIGQAFGESQDPQLAAEAGAMLERVRSLDAGLDNKLRAMLLGEADSDAPVMATISQLLEADGAGAGTLAEMAQVAQFMEMTDRYEMARQVYQKIVQVYQSHPEAELSAGAVEQAQNGLKRVDLIGKPLVVQGATLDGSPFDWSAYQGKIVLVDFWATWCQPCLMEMPNIARVHREYHDRGFEVIGISLDDDPRIVQRFMEVQPLPWTILVGADEERQGIANPLAVECGVDTLPFVVLVDRDGNVAALHARGPRLEEKLTELLDTGEAPTAASAPATDPTAPAGQPATGDQPDPQLPAPPAPDLPLEPPADAQSAAPADAPQPFFVSLLAADEPPPALGADDPAPAAGLPTPPKSQPVDLYAPQAGLSPAELVDYILAMQDKPRSIQDRPGFGEALVLAADRILAAEPTNQHRGIAVQTKFDVLHLRACEGDDPAEAALVEFVAWMEGTADPKIAERVRFFQLERKALGADELPLDELPELLSELKNYLAEQQLQDRHLRLASSTVGIINRLEDAQQRETYFQEFGGLFAKSQSKELSRYGRGVAGQPSTTMPQLVGKPLEVTGVTALGTAFDWSSYRGKVVLVDFWASWCGPCRAAMPQLKTLHEELRKQGFAVVGVSLDKDQAAMTDYLEENGIQWTNVVGEDASALATKYGIRALPTMILVDRAGVVVAAGHKLPALKPQLDKLLQG